MIMDQNLNFSTAQAITASAASTNIIDLTGVGSGNTPNLSFGNASTFGEDLGLGVAGVIPQVIVSITTAFATLTSLNIAFQGAPDSGSNTPGAWTTYGETGAIPVASLTLNGVIRLFWNPVQIAAALPRFIRLFYTVAGSNATAGALTANIVINRDDNIVGKYPAGFAVA